jgi:ribosomal protein S18 acetylase RimI-like enzyme
MAEIFSINSYKVLQDLFDTYSKNTTQTNNYLLASHYEDLIRTSKLFALRGEENLLLLAERNASFQVYYFLNNFQEFLPLNFIKPLMMEIVYRGELKRPSEILNYWEANGFNTHLTRDNLGLVYKNKLDVGLLNASVIVKLASIESEAKYAHDLFEKDLDIYTGDLKTQEEIDTYVANNNLLCAYFDGNLCGALQFEIKNKVVWLGHIVVDSQYRGKGIANSLVEKYLSMNEVGLDTRFQLWVINNNNSAVNLYKRFGFTYAGKSTVSMLKLN